MRMATIEIRIISASTTVLAKKKMRVSEEDLCNYLVEEDAAEVIQQALEEAREELTCDV